MTLKKYSAQLSLTTLICFVGTLQAIAVTLIMEREPSAWAIGFDMNLLAAAYAVSTLSLPRHIIISHYSLSHQNGVAYGQKPMSMGLIINIASPRKWLDVILMTACIFIIVYGDLIPTKRRKCSI